MKNLLLILAAIVLFASCSTHKAYKHRSSSSPSYYNASGSNDVLALRGSRSDGSVSYSDGISSGVSDDASAFADAQMVIYNASMSLTVKKPDSVVSKIDAIAKRYEGYLVSGGSNRAVIRVKSEFLNQALRDIGMLGKVTYQNIYGDDVTEQYANDRIRLDNAYQARDRYLELLKKAEDVQAALAVEKELERLNGEINLLEGNLKRIEHLVNYSTISIDINERKQPGILGYVFIGLYKGVKWLFVWN